MAGQAAEKSKLTATQTQIAVTLLTMGPGQHKFDDIVNERFREKGGCGQKGIDETDRQLKLLVDAGIAYGTRESGFGYGPQPESLEITASKNLKDIFFAAIMGRRWVVAADLCTSFYEEIKGREDEPGLIREFVAACEKYSQISRNLNAEARTRSAARRHRLGIQIYDDEKQASA